LPAFELGVSAERAAGSVELPVLRPTSQPQVTPRIQPIVSSVTLRSGLRWAFEATPRAVWRTVALAAFFPSELRVFELRVFDIKASVLARYT
jgi:hypothetical protein